MSAASYLWTGPRRKMRAASRWITPVRLRHLGGILEVQHECFHIRD
jgi:hypothetical protein